MKKKINLIFDGLIMPFIVYVSFIVIFTTIYKIFIEEKYEMNELLIQTFASAFIIICYIFMYKIFCKKYEIKSKNVERKSFLYLIPLGISLCVLFNILLIMVLKNTDNPVSKSTEELLEKYPIIVTVIAISIFPPLIEELFFRGFAYHVFKSFFNDIVAIVTTSLLFSISHGNIVQGIYAFSAGLFIGYIRYKCNNIVYSIMLHLIMNLSALIFGAAIIMITDTKTKIFTIMIMGVIATISLYRIIKVNHQ